MNGYIALISVLIILAVISTGAITAAFLSIGEAGMGLQKNQSSEAYYLASACGEEALQQINDFPLFQGIGILTFDNGDCQYRVAGNTISASGVVNSFVRRIQIVISQISPVIIISSWQEVADF